MNAQDANALLQERAALRTPEFYQAHGDFDAPVGVRTASLWGRITFSWASPLLHKGIRGELQESTGLAFLPPRDDAALLSAQFWARYADLKGRGGKWVQGHLLTSTLLSLHWRVLLLQFLWCAGETVVRVLSPVALRYFILWLSRYKADPDAYPVWQGWLWALALASSGLIYTLVIAAVYDKVLRLNSATIADVTVGKIVNLVSSDVRRLDDAGPFWVFLVNAPCELAAVTALIAVVLGPAPAFAGVSVLLLMIPVQALLTRYIKHLRACTAHFTDERVRLSSEVISGIMAVKMLSSEDAFEERLKALRLKEQHYSKQMARIRAINMSVEFCFTPFATFVTFTVARVTSDALTVWNVFFAIALLHLPKLSMATFFVRAIEVGSELVVGMRRIGAFLDMQEPSVVQNLDDAARQEGIALSFRGADFDWEHQQSDPSSPSDTPPRGPASTTNTPPMSPHAILPRSSGPTLRALHFDVLRGQLVAIVGAVGSGKSSLLAALLGELQPLQWSRSSGDCKPADTSIAPMMDPDVAYCAQVPWIMSGSVRSNILFGQPFDKARYTSAIDASALTVDLAALPAGDETELGERGINLSGGQKARVALARALYSQRSVVLLDDPLSAVDPRVGATIFQRALGSQGMLKGSTRLLVTHQRQYLPACDRVLVLRDGQLIAQGTYAELAAAGLPEVVLTGDDVGGTLPDVETWEIGSGEAQGPLLQEEHYGEQETCSTREENGGGNKGEGALSAGTENSNAKGGEDPVQDQSVVPGQGEQSLVPGQGSTADPASTPFAAASDDVGIVEHEGSDRAGAALRKSISTYFQVGGQRCSEQPSSLPRAKSRIGLRMASRYLSRLRSTDPSPTTRRTRQRTTGAPSSTGWKAKTQLWMRRVAGLPETPLPRGDRDGVAELKATRSGRLVMKESAEKGSVSGSVYGEYCRCMGVLVVVLVLTGLIVGQVAFVGSEYWLVTWSVQDPDTQQEWKWVWGYSIFIGVIIVMAFSRALLFYGSTLRAATRINGRMVHRVLRAPLAFFHTNPSGRVLNRFSKDQSMTDEVLPQVSFDALQSGFMVIGAFVLVSWAVPVILPTFIPLLLVFVHCRNKHLTTSREIKRLDATTRSPVFANFSATLKGLCTIRAYGDRARFAAEFDEQMDANGAWWYCFICAARWVGVRLDFISACTLIFATVLMMLMRDFVSARMAGLALVHVLGLSGILQWMVRQTAESENTMTSVERMLEYTRLPQEPPTTCDGAPTPPKGWPSAGALSYQGVSASYRPGLPLVLCDLSFSLPAGATCGVVGRTGSGKSSLLLTLFRMLDITEGRIMLDGVDTASIGLDALRRQLAVIPQDPVLFSGTLRANVDVREEHDDAAVWDALRTVQLADAVTAMGGLHARMADAGDNLSVGQRQLLCLARALLQQCAVMALDEATANIDRATDRLIQSALRRVAGEGRGGQERTLLVIAHRINTIQDCDVVLVLSQGQLLEQGAPKDLVGKGGHFAGMVAAASAITYHH